MNRGPRFALREATAACHDRVDVAFGRFDLSDAADYGRFLRAHARAFLPAEAALDAAAAETLLPDWPDRRRSGWLKADLAALGLDAPAPLDAPVPATAPAIWGMLYVLEGSRLGGAMLARSVAAGLPKSYLDSGQPGADWRNFLAALEVALADTVALEAARQAAEHLFALFERAARTELESAADDG